MSQHLAIDLGAESGRVILGNLSNGYLRLKEIHRFVNGAINYKNSLRWDIARIWNDISYGIKLACHNHSQIDSIGVNSWGVDYALFDKDNKLLERPYHYRDLRTERIQRELHKIVSREELYRLTGIQTLSLNTIFQLYAFKKESPRLFDRIHRLLYIPDWINYKLTGKLFNEYTIASTSQMMDMRTGTYSDDVLKMLEIPDNIFPDIVQPGEKIGYILPEVAARLGCGSIPVYSVASHDTASAVAAIPAESDENWAYLSSGTWSLMGVEKNHVIINESTNSLQLTNEGGVANTIRLLKNIVGMWAIQECKKDWKRKGFLYNYTELTNMAKSAKPFSAFIDVEDKAFFSPGDMERKIVNYLAEKGQGEEFSHSQIVRTILEGLAYRYSYILSKIEEITNENIDNLHIVGGGSQNKVLNQLTADATKKTVISGPVEATVCGNILVQAMGLGEVDSLNEMRSIVLNSFDFKKYEPKSHDKWDKMRHNFQKICTY